MYYIIKKWLNFTAEGRVRKNNRDVVWGFLICVLEPSYRSGIRTHQRTFPDSYQLRSHPTARNTYYPTMPIL